MKSSIASIAEQKALLKNMELICLFFLERRRLQHYSSGSEPHTSFCPKLHYRKMYFEACDVLLGELQNRFESKTIPAVVSMEKALIKAATIIKNLRVK